MRVGITGATGFVGRPLVAALRARGDTVVAFSRDPVRAAAVLGDGVRCRGLAEITAAAFADLDAVVNLAGESVAGTRWTDEHKAAIRASRLDVTRAVVSAIVAASPRPAVLVSASAVGYYGDRRDQPVDETTGPGADFLAGVCAAWEQVAQEAERVGVRVVRLRIGLVLGEGGGALEQMILPFRLGVGGPIGDGTQYVPWVHRDDVVGLVLFALDRGAVTGAVNATGPEVLQNRDLAKILGAALHRPAWFRVPGFALKLAVGEMSEVLLTGQRVVPAASLEAGYEFRYPNAEAAVRSILDDARAGRSR